MPAFLDVEERACIEGRVEFFHAFFAYYDVLGIGAYIDRRGFLFNFTFFPNVISLRLMPLRYHLLNRLATDIKLRNNHLRNPLHTLRSSVGITPGNFLICLKASPPNFGQFRICCLNWYSFRSYLQSGHLASFSDCIEKALKLLCIIIILDRVNFKI